MFFEGKNYHFYFLSFFFLNVKQQGEYLTVTLLNTIEPGHIYHEETFCALNIDLLTYEALCFDFFMINIIIYSCTLE